MDILAGINDKIIRLFMRKKWCIYFCRDEFNNEVKCCCGLFSHRIN